MAGVGWELIHIEQNFPISKHNERNSEVNPISYQGTVPNESGVKVGPRKAEELRQRPAPAPFFFLIFLNIYV